ncbi:DUF1499 domain-containing protein [Congregibacter litoralis]|uniref:DUF1499 domain-containing protein n=1 Tax=Congregibacter litoralis KT71 TaxID=314285 RepID=A4AAN7_9GAMM|nr:DUF1499 domain-containing protein [Congregibacter litoralis]EAQ96759.1 hypothetical protein KT71_10679 [Congregibacter litoralis KT71]
MSDVSSPNASSSAWIRWPGYLAWFFLLMLALSVLIVRSGNWQQGLLIYALAGLLSILVLAFMAVQSLLPRWRGERMDIFKRALPALPGAVLLLLAMQGREVPPIHNISTDLQDPPAFEKIADLRGDSSNPLALTEDVKAQQREAYPDLGTIESPRSYASSYNLALTTAQDLGWDIVREDPTGGFIEAVDTTAIMQFKDDVVIRVRTNETGSLIDLRSVSRVGVSDLGANAKRIRDFISAFQAAAGS